MADGDFNKPFDQQTREESFGNPKINAKTTQKPQPKINQKEIKIKKTGSFVKPKYT